jgi:hypothetical protein
MHAWEESGDRVFSLLVKADEHRPQCTQRDQHGLFCPDRVGALVWADVQIHVEERLCVLASKIGIITDHIFKARNATKDEHQMSISARIACITHHTSV